MIKIDEITEIEIKDGTLTINQFDNNNVILSQDNLKKIFAAINYTHCCTELKGKQPMTFDEWINFNKYTKKTIGYKRNQILFGYEEMMQRYIGYKQSL
jgi:hypothetical protein